jgi:hypothetical protein
MKTPLLAWIFATLALTASAADTPSNMGESPLADVRAAMAEKNWTQALQNLRSRAPDQASSADFHNLMGFVLRHQVQPDMRLVLDHYEQALSLDPGHRQAREYLGEAWLMMHCPDQAAEQLKLLERSCGNTECEEWKDLQEAMLGYRNPNRHSCSISK